MGDFNANLLKVSTDATFLRDLTSELALKVAEHGPTNFTTVPGTWIDAIFVDSNDTIIDTENRPAPYHNSHNLMSVTLNMTTSSAPCESFTYRAFNNINPEELNSLLENCDWSPFDNVTPDLNDMLTKLTQNLTFAVDSLAPLKTVIPKKRQPPWINSELHTLYNKRDAALRRYKRKRHRAALDEFLRLRALSTDITKQVRTDYIHDSLEKTLSNNRNFWKRLRSLGLLRKSAEGLHGFSLNELNDHFAAVSCSSTESIDEATAIINIAPDEGFTFKHVSLSDVILAVAHFTSQAKDEDGIPQSVIAKSLLTIGPLLVHLFNSSLDYDVFPGAWKKAQLIPLKKKSAPTSPSDFHPIALLCFLSKVLEKLVHEQLSE